MNTTKTIERVANRITHLARVAHKSDHMTTKVEFNAGHREPWTILVFKMEPVCKLPHSVSGKTLEEARRRVLEQLNAHKG